MKHSKVKEIESPFLYAKGNMRGIRMKEPTSLDETGYIDEFGMTRDMKWAMGTFGSELICFDKFIGIYQNRDNETRKIADKMIPEIYTIPVEEYEERAEAVDRWEAVRKEVEEELLITDKDNYIALSKRWMMIDDCDATLIAVGYDLKKLTEEIVRNAYLGEASAERIKIFPFGKMPDFSKKNLNDFLDIPQRQADELEEQGRLSDSRQMFYLEAGKELLERWREEFGLTRIEYCSLLNSGRRIESIKYGRVGAPIISGRQAIAMYRSLPDAKNIKAWRAYENAERRRD
ncbi:MAG: hypothetical protein ABIH72_01440 [archaeon]